MYIYFRNKVANEKSSYNFLEIVTNHNKTIVGVLLVLQHDFNDDIGKYIELGHIEPPPAQTKVVNKLMA